MTGWIKLHRQLHQSDMYCDLNSVQRDVMTQCLLMANHNEIEWDWKGKIHKCKPGQFKTSLAGILKNCAKGTTIKMVRTALKKLEKWQFLASDRAKQGRIITVINWNTYQVKFQPEGKEAGMIGATNNNNKEIKKKEAAVIPDILRQNGFFEAWEEFREYRRSIGKPMNRFGENKVLAMLERNSGQAIPIMEQSIINGWVGVYPLKPKTQAEINQGGPNNGLVI